MNKPVDLLVGRLKEAQQSLLKSLDGIPDSELRIPPSDGEWSVAQVCAHVVEMQLNWLKRAERISELPDVGRNETERKRRLSEVTDHAGDDIDQVTRRIHGANEEALRILGGLTPAHLELEGIRGGEPITARHLVENSVIKHIHTHAEQINESRRTVHGRTQA